MSNKTEERRVKIITDGSQSTASIKQMQAAARLLHNEMLKLPKDSKEFKEAMDKWRQADERFRSATAEVKRLDKASTSMWANIKQIAIGSVIGNLAANGVTSLFGKMKGFVTTAADLSDEMSNIQKTTAMTNEEVIVLNKELGEIQTRTSKSDLRGIAIGLGQIGEEVNKINVEAIDKIVVALSDEFGMNPQEITAGLGTLRNNLQDIKTENYDQDILHIGNALNIAGAEGLATAPVVTDIANRIAGAGQQFDVSSGQILGMAASFQELGINTERGSTAIVRLFQKIAEKPAAFAAVAGMQVKEFTDLVNTDMYGAFISVAKGAQDAAKSNTEFAAILEDLESKGVGVGEVLTKFGTNAKLVEGKVRRMGEALQETSSITSEFDIKNNNLAGRLSQLDKSIAKMFGFENLGDTLKGLVEQAIAFTNWVQRNGNAILGWIKVVGLALTVWAAYKAAVWTNTIYLKLMNGEILKNSTLTRLSTIAQQAWNLAVSFGTRDAQGATKALKLLNAEIKANPFGLVVSLATAAAGAMMLFGDNTEDATESMDKMKDAAAETADFVKQTTENTDKEITQLNTLVEKIKGTKHGTKERTSALREFQEVYGVYLEDLQNEKEFLNNLEGAQKKLGESMLLRMQITLLQRRLDKEGEGSSEINSQIFELDANIKAYEERLKKGQKINMQFYDQDKRRRAKLIAEAGEFKDKLSPIVAEINALQQQLQGNAIPDNSPKRGGGGYSSPQPEAKKKTQAEILKEKFEAAKEVLKNQADAAVAILNEQYAQQKISKLDYDTQVQNLELVHLSKMKKLYTDYKENTAEIDMKITDIHIQQRADELQRSKDEFETAKGYLKDWADVQQTVVNDRYTKGEIAKEEYDARMLMLELKALQAEKQLFLDYGKDTTEIDKKISELKVKSFDDANKEIKKGNDELEKDAEKFWKDFGKWARQAGDEVANIYQGIIAGIAQKENAELDSERRITDEKIRQLEVRREAGTISQKEFEDRKAAIEKEYDKKAAEVKRLQFERNRKAMIAEAIINTATSVTKALTGSVPPFNFILAGLSAAAGAIQIANIANQPVPEYGEGSMNTMYGLSGRKYNARRGKNYGNYSSPTYIVGENGGEKVLPPWLISHPKAFRLMKALDATMASKNINMLSGAMGSGSDPLLTATLMDLNKKLAQPFRGNVDWDQRLYDRNKDLYDRAEKLSNF